MENIFVFAGVIAITYCIVKFIETKYLKQDENKSLNQIVKDSIVVYISSLLGYFFVQQLTPFISDSSLSHPDVFTDSPSF